MKWYPPELRGCVFVVDVAPLGTLLTRYFSTEEYEGIPEARDNSSDDGADGGGGWEGGGDKQGDGNHEDGDDDEKQEEVNDGEDDKGDGEWVGNTRWKPQDIGNS